MFCDLVDSMALSDRFDPEEFRELVRAYQNCCERGISDYEGHVAQYLGDGLLIYFGYPRAHDDDAERAVRAARDIVNAMESLGPELGEHREIGLAVRIGIHTGPVVVGEMGTGAARQTLALGQTTNIAARLQSIAEPGAVVISDATLRLVAGLFVTRDLGMVSLKGVADPVRTHRVVQASGVRGRLRSGRQLTPMIGRQHEVELLFHRWENVREGRGQGVAVSGEPGIGKSRVVQEFRDRLTGTAHSWLEARCASYTKNSPFRPVIELVEAALNFREGDPPERRLDLLEQALTLAGFDPSEAVPLFASLLSLPLPPRDSPLDLSPDVQRKRTIETLLAWILRLAEQQPMVVVFEDLHWCDPSTLEVLGLLLEQCATAQLLLVLTFRPEFEPKWSRLSHLTPLVIGRLGRRDSATMVTAVTAEREFSDALIEGVIERGDGVPIFIEELSKMFLEAGGAGHGEEAALETGAVKIPATLQDLLMERLDRLNEAKEIAQFCAAVGREFSYEVLRAASPHEDAVLRDGLARLVEVDMLYQRGVIPRATFAFKHALIQDAAYQSLLLSTRKVIHARIAHVLEEKFSARSQTQPEVLARHYERAQNPLKAVTHYLHAGEQAAARCAPHEAIRHLKRGIRLLRDIPDAGVRDRLELQLWLALGIPLGISRSYANEEVGKSYRRARDLCHSVGDAHQRARALRGLFSFHLDRGELPATLDLAKELIEVANRTGDSSVNLVANLCMGMALFWPGELRRALTYLNRAIALYDPQQHRSLAYAYMTDQGVSARVYAAMCLLPLGDPDQALRLNREAAELAREADHPFSLGFALISEVRNYVLLRDREQVLELVDKPLALASRMDFPLFVGLGRVGRGWALCHEGPEGQGTKGIEEIQAGLAQLANRGSGVAAPQILGILADAHRELGQMEQGLRVLELALSFSESKGVHFYDSELLRLKGELVLQQGNEREAESLFRRALEVARRQEVALYELRAAVSLGRCLQAHGRGDDARSLVTAVGVPGESAAADLRAARAFLESF
jgi:class 3 adenylate cyclase/tetratricopeptide (TPR) repeat protein